MKKRLRHVWLLFAELLLVVVFLSGGYYYSRKNMVNTVTNKPNMTNIENKIDNDSREVKGATEDSLNDQEQVPQVADQSADGYYQQGLKFMESQDWQSSITQFDLAINKDNMVADYYIKKSEAQNKLGLKQEAISTIEKGLASMSNNVLLKDQLTVLNGL